jgi:magnesium transporter
MSRLVKKKSKQAGLPPGALVHTGERSAQEVKVSIIDYDEAGVRETRADNVNQCAEFRDRPSITWLNIEGLHKVELLEKLGECYGFHPLTLEDILNTDQRPKIEDYDSYLYIVLKMLRYVEATGEVSSEQVSIILGKNFVFSFQEGLSGDLFDTVRERIRSGKGKIRKMGADYLAYSLLDAIVDGYFVILERFGTAIEDLDAELVSNPTEAILRKIHALKKEMLFLKKAVWPLREVLGTLERGDHELINEQTSRYLGDIYDHSMRVIDSIETYREMISGMLDLYMSSLSWRISSVMKSLTIIATIFMPLTLIASFYGMNFRSMPGLENEWGYAAVLGLMLSIGSGMFVYFRKKKWL